VVRIEKNGKLIGYGEHPYVEEALRHADEDTAAGGRKYDEVYGKLYDHYLTGSVAPSSKLDAWVIQGRTFDVTYEDEHYVARMSASEEVRTPEAVVQRVLATGAPETCTVQGRVLETTRSRFPNGEPCVSTRLVEGSGWFQKTTRTGLGSTIMEALLAGLLADPVEIKEE